MFCVYFCRLIPEDNQASDIIKRGRVTHWNSLMISLLCTVLAREKNGIKRIKDA